MDRLAPCHVFSVDAADTTDAVTWAAACASRLAAGDRMLMLYGRPDGAQAVILHALLQDRAGTWQLLRASSQRGDVYPALTPQFPALQMLERELWEQCAVQPQGHPWLKPVRFEGAWQQRMVDYPFFAVRGAGVHEVGVGPVHAGVIEPGHFRFMCLGEKVHHLELQLGYQHRGVEVLLRERSTSAQTPLVERLVGDSSVAYAWGYCAALEELSSAQPPLYTEMVRGVALELERIAMHLATLAGLATDLAFLQGGATYARLRTAIINATQRMCGSRFGRGWLRPGGVRHALGEARRCDLRFTLEAFASDLAEVNALVCGAMTVRSRLQGVGLLDTLTATETGMQGLVARASGVALDARSSHPFAVYQAFPIAMQLEVDGDCWARMQLRLREMDASVAWLQGVLGAAANDMGAAGLQALPPLAPGSLCVSLVEGVRGTVLQALETDAQGRVQHHKVQDPSLHNWFGLALAMRNNDISDFPVCNKSFDLSYCGNDL